MSIKDGCSTENLLVRDGTSQAQRTQKALDPDYAKIDERNFLDLINFAREYSKEIQFYDINNKKSGDWEAFYNNDIASLIASISSVDIKQLIADKNTLIDKLNDPTTTKTELKGHFKICFNLLLTLAFDINSWYKKSVKGLKLNRELDRLIKANLSRTICELIGAYKEAKKAPKLINNSTDAETVLNYPVKNISEIIDYSFENIWIKRNDDGTLDEDWDTYVNNIDASKSMFGPDRSDEREAITFAANKIEVFLEQFIAAIRQLIVQSPELIEETFEKYNKHEPHIALFLAFIQVFKYAQNHLNTITRRHLDFYYKEVLQLKTEKQVPDRVHLIFELAKHVSDYKIKKGVTLKAGKDDTGKELIYKTSNDLVANKTTIGSLKSVFIDHKNNDKIFAAPIVNSADGQGGEFEEDNPKWKAFGSSQIGLGRDEQTMMEPEAGFAITSNVLVLNEGRRSIEVIVKTSQSLKSSLNQVITKGFSYALTTEKGWLKDGFTPLLPKEKFDLVNRSVAKIIGKNIHFKIHLGSDKEAILPYVADTHQGSFNTSFPLLKILCQGDEKNYPFKTLKDLEIGAVSVKVKVKDLKNLQLQSDSGNIDPAKPFTPFGARPLKGSNFLIGSSEVFSKDLTELSLSGDWVDLPDKGFKDHYKNYYKNKSFSGSSFKVNIKGLHNGNWNESLKSNVKLFDEFNIKGRGTVTEEEFKVSVFDQSTIKMKNDQIEGEIQPYSIKTKSGFIKLEIASPDMAFGHHDFPSIYAAKSMQQVSKGANFDINKLPTPPYTPTLKEFSLNYEALVDIDLSDATGDKYKTNEGKFFHLYPFGYKDIHVSLDQATPTFLPQFNHVDEESQVIEHQGEFYIGLKDLDPPQSVAVLFKVAEGSEDPELNKQKIKWFYLEKNLWKAFEKQDILFDTTNDLLKEGIIKWDISRGINNNNTLLPSGYYWIKGVVDKNNDAICDVQKVQAQALEATFEENDNDPNHLSKKLTAESISKLVNRDSSVKSVTQPYASFGGKMAEQPHLFYRRVSERLRHKHRGLTIWDYEHLVLEEFPKIYKAKCINHSTYAFEDDNQNIINSEFAPGFVTLVVIPDLINDNAADPFKPKASKALLEEIKTFLKGIMPHWVKEKLQVLNPQYEEIKVEFEVEFNTSDRGYYEKLLNDDIKKFLSPWAYEEGKDLVFGGKLHRSVVLNYIEELDYVDYIEEFKMHHFINGELHEKDIEEAQPTSARSIFATIVNKDYKKEHIIKEISE